MKVNLFTVTLLVPILFIACGDREIQTTVRQIPTPTVPGGNAEKHFYKHFYKGISAAAAGDFKTAAIAFSKAQPQDYPQMIPYYDLTAKRSIEIIRRVERGLLDREQKWSLAPFIIIKAGNSRKILPGRRCINLLYR